MEGVLWKWTNYWSGWQTRWFVLDNCVLSYYKSQEEVNQGCKGSIKVSACEIIVHPVDSTRMDLVIPGEQHFYLKAATSQERQQWLVALGSAKACVTTKSRKDSSKSDSNPDTLKSKKSELRLYCDLLMQQVHMVKTSATQEGGPQVEKLDEATSLLSATCDTFIKTLEDCMKISNANFTYELPHQHVTDTALPAVSNQVKGKVSKPTVPVMMRSNSVDRLCDREISPDRDSDGLDASDNEDSLYWSREIPGIHCRNFFNQLPTSFLQIQIQRDGGIPAQIFLDAATSIASLLDILGTAAFTTIKLDLQNNVQKLLEYHGQDPANLSTLQSLVMSEVRDKSFQQRNSATEALLWLQRELKFIRELLEEFVDSEADMSTCSLVAYNRTLKLHHGWMTRNVFAVSVRGAPTREDFITSLALGLSDVKKPNFKKQLMEDVRMYITILGVLLKSLEEFYEENCIHR